MILAESRNFRDYLSEILGKENIKIIQSRNGSDALAKMSSDLPDLAICDCELAEMTFRDFCAEKAASPDISKIPLIALTSEKGISNKHIPAAIGINAVFEKPLKLDLLLKEISEIINTIITVDTTPCIIEAHINDRVLFIQISDGLNIQKIKLLRYRINELMDLYKLQSPQVLILIAGCSGNCIDNTKLDLFFRTVYESTQTGSANIKIISNSNLIKSYVLNNNDFNIKKTQIFGSLEEALEILNRDNPGHTQEKIDAVISDSDSIISGKEEIRLDFNMENIKDHIKTDTSKIKIAIVDDDPVTCTLVGNAFQKLKWNTTTYNDGIDFIRDSSNIDSYNVVFLDLLMPRLGGLGVLEELKKRNLKLPVIILSSLHDRSLVVKTISLGVKGYLVKPLKPNTIILKALEIIKSSLMHHTFTNH